MAAAPVRSGVGRHERESKRRLSGWLRLVCASGHVPHGSRGNRGPLSVPVTPPLGVEGVWVACAGGWVEGRHPHARWPPPQCNA